MKATSIEPLGATCTREVCTKSQNLLHKHHYENEWSLDQKTSLRVCLREKSILHCKKGKKHHPHPFSLPLLWNVSLRPWEKGRHPWDQQDTGKGPLQLREGGKKKKKPKPQGRKKNTSWLRSSRNSLQLGEWQETLPRRPAKGTG